MQSMITCRGSVASFHFTFPMIPSPGEPRPSSLRRHHDANELGRSDRNDRGDRTDRRREEPGDRHDGRDGRDGRDGYVERSRRYANDRMDRVDLDRFSPTERVERVERLERLERSERGERYENSRVKEGSFVERSRQRSYDERYNERGFAEHSRLERSANERGERSERSGILRMTAVHHDTEPMCLICCECFVHIMMCKIYPNTQSSTDWSLLI